MLRIILLFIFLYNASSAFGHDAPLTFDRVRLSATASAEVANDTLVAVLYAQREGQDATELSSTVNAAVAWALDQAKAIEATEVQTLGYQTQPIYQNRRLSGWRVRQSLRLESTEPDRLARLVGTLQERLAVESITYAVSTARQRDAEDALMVEALAAFRARAELVRKELGASDYRLVEIGVDGGGPVPMPRASMAMEMRSAAVAPALEPGTRDVHVSVNGIIELERR